MKKIDSQDVLFLIESIVFTIFITIDSVYLIPFICELSINGFGLNIGSFITAVVGYFHISLIVVCIIGVIKAIQCIFFYK